MNRELLEKRQELQKVADAINTQSAMLQHKLRELTYLLGTENENETTFKLRIAVFRNALWKIGALELGHLLNDYILEQTGDPFRDDSETSEEELRGLLERSIMNDFTVNMPDIHVE